MNGELNREKLYRTLTSLDIFVDKSLKLKPKGSTLSGFHYNGDLIYAATANTYLETVGNKADSIHLDIKEVPISSVYWEYLKTVELLGERAKLKEQQAVLAFDYTEEEFYGEVETFWIHGWTGKRAVIGKFKFLTCALVNDGLKIPLLSIPVSMGCNMAKDVIFCLSLIKPLVGPIKLTLFDRGFYSKELMLTLTRAECPYLIFVPKNKRVKSELEEMAKDEKKTIHYEFKVNKDKTKEKESTTLAFLKQVFDPRSERDIDWAFATDLEEVNLDHLIQTYKQRWRIETGFRIQDEARIKSKSKDIKIRFFYFAYEQLLQLIWNTIYKEEVSFKRFLILLNETSKERAEKAERRAKRSARMS
jgi:hypothetical protein